MIKSLDRWFDATRASDVAVMEWYATLRCNNSVRALQKALNGSKPIAVRVKGGVEAAVSCGVPESERKQLGEFDRGIQSVERAAEEIIVFIEGLGVVSDTQLDVEASVGSTIVFKHFHTADAVI